MNEHPLYQIMHPKSVAIVGASNDYAKMGTIQLLNLLGGKFEGKIYPIHPQEKTVMGLKAYRNARDLPEPADLAIVTIPNSAVLQVLTDLGERGVKRAVIISGGFKETGESGTLLQEEILKIARRYGIRFVGPNCIGVIHPAFHFNPTMYPYLHKPGAVGVASQSGTYVTQIIPYLSKFQIGYSQAFSVGNGADMGLTEVIEYLGQDPATKAIAVYIEGIKNPREFIRVVSQVTRRKPVVALYVGGTEAGARAAASHTASISGPDHLYNGLFQQAGVIRAYSVEDLFEWSFALASAPPLKGKNIAILTHSGGPASSLSDACNRWGLNVPVFSESMQEKIRRHVPATGSTRNPVDLTFFTDLKGLLQTIPEIILSDPSIDGLLIHGIQGGTFFRSVIEANKNVMNVPSSDQINRFKEFFFSVLENFIKFPQKFDKPVITSAFGDRRDEAVAFIQDQGIPCYGAPERAARAMAALFRYAEIRDKKSSE